MFWHMAGTVKTLIFLRFFKVFRYSGVLEGLVGTSWRPCWTILGPRCGQEGYKMDDFGQVGDLGGHLGAKMGHDGVKMAILVSTLAALVPSWA